MSQKTLAWLFGVLFLFVVILLIQHHDIKQDLAEMNRRSEQRTAVAIQSLQAIQDLLDKILKQVER